MHAPEPPEIAAGDLIWIWEPLARRIVWATPGAVRFWGERSLEDLAARRFSAEDPNARAMATLENARADAAADKGEREARLLLFPDGAPRRLTCRGLLRDLDAPGGARRWMAVSARPSAAETPPAPAARAAKESLADSEARADAVARRLRLLERAATPLGLLSADGAPIHLNPAAEALFGLRAPYPADALFARMADPAAARRAAAAALSLGAFGHTMDLRRPGEARGAARERAHLIYRRIDDPAGGEAMLGLEAHFRAAPTAPAFDALAAAAPEALEATRLASAAFALEDLKLIQASPAFRRLLAAHEPALWSGGGAPRLTALFPEKAKHLRAIAERMRQGTLGAETIDLPIGSAYGRGPWAIATLALDAGAGAPRLILQLADLGPERRSLLRQEQERRAAGAALAALGAGYVLLSPDGVIRSVTPGAAALLGGTAERLQGAALPPLLAAPEGARLAAALAAGPSREPEERFTGPRRLILLGQDGVRRRAAAALTPAPAIGPKLACLALMRD